MRKLRKLRKLRKFPNAKMRVTMNECIAALMCGGVRDRPGGPVQKVVAVGGSYNGYLSTVEVYDVISNTWTRG